MPRATRQIEATVRKDLKSCPGGFVILRRMSYGEKLHRQNMTKMSFTGNRRTKDFEGELNMMNEAVALFEFGRCVVDHNLTDDQDRKLDFTKADDVRSLEGQIGEEIDTYIGEMNNFEEEDNEDPEGNF